jgi:hypothetical protein
MGDRIIGAFFFADLFARWRATEPRAARLMERLAAYGVNAVFTEAEDYDDPWIALVHAFGLRWFASIACFSDHANHNRVLHERPELWPVDETGDRRAPMEWYIGVTPTYEDYADARLERIAELAAAHAFDGLMLDFCRWPIHWELESRPGARASQSSFDAHSIRRFQEFSGITVPGGTAAERASWILQQAPERWTDFKCATITRFVRAAVDRLRGVRSDLPTGVFVLPLESAQRESLAGQRIPDLTPLVAYVAPMAYHAILHRPPAWAVQTIGETVHAAPGKTLAVLQVDSREGPALGSDWGPPVPAEEWGNVARGALAIPGVCGCVAFPGTALDRDGRGALLKRVST